MDLDIAVDQDRLNEVRQYVDAVRSDDRAAFARLLNQRVGGAHDLEEFIGYLGNIFYASVQYASALVDEPIGERANVTRLSVPAITVNMPEPSPRTVRKTVVRDEDGMIIAVEEEEVDAWIAVRAEEDVISARTGAHSFVRSPPAPPSALSTLGGA